VGRGERPRRRSSGGIVPRSPRPGSKPHKPTPFRSPPTAHHRKPLVGSRRTAAFSLLASLHAVPAPLLPAPEAPALRNPLPHLRPRPDSALHHLLPFLTVRFASSFQLIYWAVQRCRMSESPCRLTVSLKAPSDSAAASSPLRVSGNVAGLPRHRSPSFRFRLFRSPIA
jgi:hypothetical protein